MAYLSCQSVGISIVQKVLVTRQTSIFQVPSAPVGYYFDKHESAIDFDSS